MSSVKTRMRALFYPRSDIRCIFSHDWQKLRRVAHKFARDYGITLPSGMQKHGSPVVETAKS
jgi:hypothetical protein